LPTDIKTVPVTCRHEHSDRGVLGLSSEDDADAEFDEEEDDEADVRDLDDVSTVTAFVLHYGMAMLKCIAVIWLIAIMKLDCIYSHLVCVHL